MNDISMKHAEHTAACLNLVEKAMSKPKPECFLTPHEPAIRRLLAEHRLLRMALRHLLKPTWVGRDSAENHARKCLAVVGHKPLVAADVLGQRAVYDLWRDEDGVQREVAKEVLCER